MQRDGTLAARVSRNEAGCYVLDTRVSGFLAWHARRRRKEVHENGKS
jgi:hypothetical protein